MVPLVGIDQIKVEPSATLIFKHPALEPLHIRSGASAIQWAYHLNTASTPTIGGEVVQVLSATVGPMTIKGQTAGLKTNKSGQLAKNEMKGWKNAEIKTSFTPYDELREIMEWFRFYMLRAGTDASSNSRRDERAIEFLYPARQWHFYLQVTKLDGFRYDREVIAPEWSITAEVVNDNALNYFSGITMSSFTDDLIVNQSLVGRIGLSAFANSKTEMDNRAFGETGQVGSTNPFLNPELSINASEAAKKMGDNFQRLVAAWTSGDFATFGFGALADNGALPQDIDAVYTEIFGAPFLGNTPPSGSTRGTTVYNGPANPGTRDQIVLMIASTFERYNLPGRLGVAVAMNESGLNPDRTQEGCTSSACGIGLFQTNGDGTGRDSRSMVKLAGQNRVYSSEQGNITPYYSAGEQIGAAGQWFNEFAVSKFPNVDFMSASNEQLAALALAAQGASDERYIAKILSLLPEAEKLIRHANAAVNTSAAVPTGSLENLAKQLLSHYGKKWFDSNGRGLSQIQKVARGELLTNIVGKQIELDPRTIQCVLALIGRGYTIGTFSWCEDHSDDGPNGHAGGMAVDIAVINGIAINVDSQQCHDLTLEVAKTLRNLKSLPIRQLICGGYGNKRAADISSQCIPGADYVYGAVTMQQHTNHIHCGF